MFSCLVGGTVGVTNWWMGRLTVSVMRGSHVLSLGGVTVGVTN